MAGQSVVARILQLLAEYSPVERDMVCMDRLSNSSFIGTNEEGMPGSPYAGGDGVNSPPRNPHYRPPPPPSRINFLDLQIHHGGRGE